MWWLVIPGVAVLGKLVYDAVTEDDATAVVYRRTKTVLEENLDRLRTELARSTGRRVAVLGQPGAGKSSLLRELSCNQAVPLPLVGQQTDATNWAEDRDAKLLCRWRDFVFADVPGYDTASHPTRVMLDAFPFASFDTFVFMVRGKVREADQRLYARLERQGQPVIVVRSFAESLDADERASVRQDLWKQLGCCMGAHVVFSSNRTGEGVQDVLQRIG